MPSALLLKTLSKRFWGNSQHSTLIQPSRTLAITCRGRPISRGELFKYTKGRFLANEKEACDRRYVGFDVDRLCAVAASIGGQYSPVHAIEKMEGGFSKALLLHKENGTEIIAKIPFPIAGSPRYTTASEVAVLQYLHMHTQVPVPRVLAWDVDSSNPVGAEYIMMEKALGVQLFKVWDEMTDQDKLSVVKHLTKLEGEMTELRFPASGSLYLRESITKNDAFIALDQDMDPSGQFCIGPSCERGWYAEGRLISSFSHLTRGPWPNLSSFGVALAEREKALIEQPRTTTNYDPPCGSLGEQAAVLEMAKNLMSRLDEPTLFLNKISEPVLWHTDLHMGNVYVSVTDPTRILSIIDWQSIVVSPLFIQARFPEFLPVDQDYTFGTTGLPKLPEIYHEMDAEDKEYAEYKLKGARLAKVYEMSSGSHNTQGYKALHIPSFLRELFVRCGEVSEEGEAPLRACLIEWSNAWNELGFVEKCPISFSESELQRHEQQFGQYRNFHEIHELARKLLGTDFDGWITPQVDFATKQQQNQELLKEVMRRNIKYNLSPEEVRRLWPYVERS